MADKVDVAETLPLAMLSAMETLLVGFLFVFISRILLITGFYGIVGRDQHVHYSSIKGALDRISCNLV